MNACNEILLTSSRFTTFPANLIGYNKYGRNVLANDSIWYNNTACFIAGHHWGSDSLIFISTLKSSLLTWLVTCTLIFIFYCIIVFNLCFIVYISYIYIYLYLYIYLYIFIFIFIFIYIFVIFICADILTNSVSSILLCYDVTITVTS